MSRLSCVLRMYPIVVSGRGKSGSMCGIRGGTCHGDRPMSRHAGRWASYAASLSKLRQQPGTRQKNAFGDDLEAIETRSL